MATNIDKFLTPESMITPGVAGSMSMMIGNTLHYQFNVPNGWAILALSFGFGLLVLAKSRSLLTKVVLYVVNSLVIFCMAAGAIALSAGPDNKEHADSFSIIRPVYAQQSMAELQAEYKKLSAQYDTLWGQLKAAPAGSNVSSLLQQVEEVDRKRATVLRSIEAQSKARSTTTESGEKKFFAPLKF